MRSTLRSIHQTSADFGGHDGFFSRVLTKLNSLWVVTMYPFAGAGRDLSLHYASEISRSLSPGIRLGNRVEIGKHTWLHTWFTPGAKGSHEVKITIEDDCRIAARCTITAKNSIQLERDVVLGSDVLIMDHAHAYQDVSVPISEQGATPGGRIRIGEGCRIGQGVAILCEKGELVLGSSCVVAPGAVVTRSFPPDSVLSGNPARAVQRSSTGQAGAGQEPLDAANIASEASGLKHADETTSWDSALSARGRQDRLSASGRGTQEGSSDRDPGGIGCPRQLTWEDPVAWFSRTAGKLRTLWLAGTYPFASFGKGAWAHYSCHVTRSAAPYISIGEDVGLARDVRLDVSAAHGTDSPVLILEARSGGQRRCVISARNRIHVMRNVIFGPSVLVMDHSREVDEGTDSTLRGQEAGGGTIRIEEECWIGFGAVIVCEQGELVIGRHSVVGANSVVRRSIPPYSVVAGDPARIVKQYDFSKAKWVLGCVRSVADEERQEPVPTASTRP